MSEKVASEELTKHSESTMRPPFLPTGKSFQWVLKPLTYALAYGAWIYLFRLCSLTILTYFLVSPQAKLQDISDTIRSNEVSLMGLSAACFVFISLSLFPWQRKQTGDLLSREHIERNFLPGFVKGSALASSLVIGLLMTGGYRYLGSYISFGEAPLALLNTILRIFALVCLVYCEEFIFHFRMLLGSPAQGLHLGSVVWVSILYCAIKWLQFDLGVTQMFTLFLISIALYLRNLRENSFASSAGFWAAILVIFHPVLSLPIFGNDFSGILLVKYHLADLGDMQSPTSEFTQVSGLSLASPLYAVLSWLSERIGGSLGGQSMSWMKWITGGAGGPLSSFIFQVLILLDIGRSLLNFKKGFPRKG